MLRIADLCSGTGAATMPFVEHLHQVDRFDLPDGDITQLHFTPGQYDFIWASPPCVQYARYGMRGLPCNRRFFKDGAVIELGLWEHCLRLIEEAGVEYYIIENVKGAYDFWGRPQHSCGAFKLWGNMPKWPKGSYVKDFRRVRSPKERARIPRGLALQVRDIIEKAYGEPGYFTPTGTY
jgi:hypothetical protein